MKTLHKIHQDTPIMDIIVAKPDIPKNDNLLKDYAADIIRGKMKMKEILNKPIFKN